MASAAECIQFALGVYAASEKNTIGVPEGWSLIDWQPDRWTGFSAGVFKNNATNEIVISFTGTNDFLDKINWTTGLGLQCHKYSTQWPITGDVRLPFRQPR